MKNSISIQTEIMEIQLGTPRYFPERFN